MVASYREHIDALPIVCIRAPTSLTGQVMMPGTSARWALWPLAGYAVNSVGIRHTAQQVTVTVVNGKSMDSSVSTRESEAMAIASLVAAAMAGKVEYGHVALIRLEFANRLGEGEDRVESFEFLRTETNTFALSKG